MLLVIYKKDKKVLKIKEGTNLESVDSNCNIKKNTQVKSSTTSYVWESIDADEKSYRKMTSS